MLHTNGKATEFKADRVTLFYNRIVALLGVIFLKRITKNYVTSQGFVEFVSRFGIN